MSLNVKKLRERSALTRLSVSKCRQSRKDDQVTEEVHQHHGAKSGAGRYTRNLWTKEMLAGVTDVETRARTHWRKRTLTWLDDGSRLCTAAGLLALLDEMRAFEEEYRTEVHRFAQNVHRFKEEMRLTQNGMFRESDYPSEAEILQEFTWEFRSDPVPDGDDFRLDGIDGGIQDQLQAQLNARVQKALADAAQEPWLKLHGVVKRFVDTLSEAKPSFQYTMFTEAAALCDLLPLLNLTGDPALGAMTQEVRTKLAQLNGAQTKDERKQYAEEVSKVMRTDRAAREATLSAANDLLAKMASYCGGAR